MLPLYLVTCALASCRPEKAESNLKAVIELQVNGRPIRRSIIWRTAIENVFPPGFETSLSGDALEIDLGRRGKIYMLARGGPAHGLHDYRNIAGLLDFVQHDRDGRDPRLLRLFGKRVDYHRYAVKKFGSELVPICVGPPSWERQSYCMDIVRFRDQRDPQSITLLDPRNLSAKLGPGIALKSMALQYTTEPQSKVDLSSLPWLKGTDPRKTLIQDSSSRDPASMITNGDFRRER